MSIEEQEIKFKVKQLNTILDQLSNIPYKYVSEIIAEIHTIAAPQLKERKETTPEK